MVLLLPLTRTTQEEGGETFKPRPCLESEPKYVGVLTTTPYGRQTKLTKGQNSGSKKWI